MSAQDPGFLDAITRLDELIAQTNDLLQQNLRQQQDIENLLGNLPGQRPGNGQVVNGQPTVEEIEEGTPPAETLDNAQYISVPSTSGGSGSRLLLPNGRNEFDLQEGKISLGDGTVADMSSGLDSLNEDRLWSMFMWVDNDCTMKINRGNKEAVSAPFFIDQCTYVIINKWPFDKLVIEPKGGFDVRVYALFSTFPQVPFDRFPVTSHQTRTVTDFSVQDSYSTIKTQHLLNFTEKAFRVKNQSSSQGDIEARVQKAPVSGSIGWVTTDTAEGTNSISPGNDYIYSTSRFSHAFRVQVRNKSGGDNNTVDYGGGGVSG